MNDEEDVLTQICRHYMVTSQCPRYMNTEKIYERQTYMDKLAKEYKADGIIYEQIKFCDYWGYERAFAAEPCVKSLIIRYCQSTGLMLLEIQDS